MRAANMEAQRAYIRMSDTIRKMHVRHLLKTEEMTMLLNLLDRLISTEPDQLAEALQAYGAVAGLPQPDEIDEIVRETMMHSDLKNPDQVQMLTDLLNSLIAEKQLLTEA